MGEIIIKKKYKVAMVCGMILYMSSVLFAFHYEFRAPQKQAEQDIFIVSPDTSKSEVIQNLYTQGYIRKRWTFKFARLFARRDIIETGGYKLSKSMNAWKIVNTLTNDPITKWVIIPEGLREEKIAKIFAKRLNWTEKKEKRFIAAYMEAQKYYFKEEAVKIFSETFNWGEMEKDVFRTIDATKYNFLEGVYIPGNYLIPIRDTALQISDRMINRIKKTEPDIEQFLKRKIEWGAASKIALFVRQEIEKLPDLVPFPASDIRLETQRGRTLLLFSTKYWNTGAGPLEFVASKKSRGKTGNINRDIYQRIYRKDGGYRDKFAGNFLWHDKHLHYHFNDFVDYILQSVDSNASFSGIRNKTTFCIQDKFKVKPTSDVSPKKAVYAICGKEKQGISVGWSDIYDYTYADQNIDVTNVPTGIYKLTFEINPERRFDEKRIDNNISSVLLRINAQEKRVEIMGEEKTI